MRLAELVARYLSRIDGPRPSGPEGARATPRLDSPAPCMPHRLGQTPQSELPPLISDWPLEWREVFEERAAIMEFDANLLRADAEARATEDVRRVHGWRDEDAAPPGGDGHHGDA